MLSSVWKKKVGREKQNPSEFLTVPVNMYLMVVIEIHGMLKRKAGYVMEYCKRTFFLAVVHLFGIWQGR